MSESISLYRKFTNTAVVMIINRALIIILGIIYARYLGPEEFGLYSFVLSIIALLAIPVSAGIPNLLIREIANFNLEKKWSYLKGIINWSCLYVLVISLIVLIIIAIALYMDVFEAPSTYILGVAIFLIPFKGLLVQQAAVLSGLRKPVLAQFPTDILLPLITLFFVFLYFYLDGIFSAYHLVSLSIVAIICTYFVSTMLLKNNIKSQLKGVIAEYSTKAWKNSLLPFACIAFVSTLNTELASVFIGWMVSTESVAYFKVGMQAVGLISLGLSAINAVIMPNVARLYKRGNLNETQALLTKSVRLSSLVSFPIILLLIIFGKFLITLLFGEAYLEAYPILIILCIGKTFDVMMGSVGVALNMTGNEQNVLKCIIMTLIINFILLTILIPIYGHIGAAIAVSLSLITWNVFMVLEVYKQVNLKTWLTFK